MASLGRLVRTSDAVIVRGRSGEVGRDEASERSAGGGADAGVEEEGSAAAGGGEEAIVMRGTR